MKTDLAAGHLRARPRRRPGRRRLRLRRAARAAVRQRFLAVAAPLTAAERARVVRAADGRCRQLALGGGDLLRVGGARDRAAVARRDAALEGAPRRRVAVRPLLLRYVGPRPHAAQPLRLASGTRSGNCARSTTPSSMPGCAWRRLRRRCRGRGVGREIFPASAAPGRCATARAAFFLSRASPRRSLFRQRRSLRGLERSIAPLPAAMADPRVERVEGPDLPRRDAAPAPGRVQGAAGRAHAPVFRACEQKADVGGSLRAVHGGDPRAVDVVGRAHRRSRPSAAEERCASRS